jgi:hypothetical protein
MAKCHTLPYKRMVQERYYIQAKKGLAMEFEKRNRLQILRTVLAKLLSMAKIEVH